VKAASLNVKQGSGSISGFAIYDQTAATLRAEWKISWAAGVPTVTINAGAGTVLFVVPRAFGFYRIGFSGNGIVAANTNWLVLYPSDNVGGGGANGDSIIVWRAQGEDAASPSTDIGTVASAVTRSADSFVFPYNAPPMVMTVYAKFVEQGTSLITSSSPRILTIGNGVYFTIFMGGTYYSAEFHATGYSTARAGAVPNIGDVVEIRAVLNADFSVTIGQSINGGAETTGTGSGSSSASAFDSPNLAINSVVSGSANGFGLYQAVRVSGGVQLLSYMQAA
jgi:hypothetical protein